MDIKITGITFEIMEKALNQAKEGEENSRRNEQSH